MAPTAIIQGIGATGSGQCNTNDMKLDDGKAAEFWSNQDNTNDWLGVPVTGCQVVDFGETCTPNEICVEAWAGDNGCSGDTCGGAGCVNCMLTHKVQLEIFSSIENSTESFQYEFSMQSDKTGNPGQVMCYGGGSPTRYVLVCRSGCIDPSNSYNAFVDYVYLN